MAKYAVWLSGLVTYAEAATILNTIGEIPISASSVWRRVAAWGPQCQAVEAAHRAASLAAIMGHCFDALWQKAYHLLPPN